MRKIRILAVEYQEGLEPKLLDNQRLELPQGQVSDFIQKYINFAKELGGETVMSPEPPINIELVTQSDLDLDDLDDNSALIVIPTHFE
jgi:hypothetical protein